MKRFSFPESVRAVGQHREAAICPACGEETESLYQLFTPQEGAVGVGCPRCTSMEQVMAISEDPGLILLLPSGEP